MPTLPPSTPSDVLRYGVAWYPEHWPEDRWPEDLRLMREAGINTVRICDFAWSTLEPADGVFELDLFERAIEQAAEFGMKVIIATPTASPPAWLTAAHPDTLAVNQDGVRSPHGGRCHYNVGSATYRQFASRIAGKLGERFGPYPQVIGWQIDNEYNRASYDAETRLRFQDFLRGRYGTLDELNRRWWTRYWSQSYSDWGQIPLPIFPSTEHPWMVHNPALRLDFQRFITQLYATYQHEQIAAIRPHARLEQVFTHNFMGFFDLFDHYALSDELDVAGFDNYIGDGHLDFIRNGAEHDLTRGLKRRNYWVLETQAGATNHMTTNNALNMGEIRSLVYHQIGHGADLISYWQWRSALGGQEQYWGTVLHPDGTPRPHYAEIAQIGAELSQLSPHLIGTTPVSAVALLHRYEDRWALNFHRQHEDFDPIGHLLSYYRPLREAGIGTDIVHPLAPLEGYRLVVAPHLHGLTPEIYEHLSSYLRGGGHLIIGPRSGVKDDDNALLPSKQPGKLAEWAGVEVEQYFSLHQPAAIVGMLGSGQASIWAERLGVRADDVEVLARYGPSNGWLDGQAAVTTRAVGAGRVTVVGAWLDAELMQSVMAAALQRSGVQTALTPPPGVEVCRRSGAAGEVTVIINHSATPQTIQLPAAHDALGGQQVSGDTRLEPYGVLVLTGQLERDLTLRPDAEPVLAGGGQ
ncbi:beta-galactosidase [Deinococcus marmoris]|uniref:Beta-galactosidase n=1 Tax=Deinococcus marmoris TaxID=249408 RepID=A0A1U7P0L2_9DEIO|nr:beta-galactosidase [Deinococcus marmoris]OLV17235.1 Beta-galactosidase [Deinococcus marmoris]OLV18704.1 Beta-galactosidase [Deinococcus marmoris]